MTVLILAGLAYWFFGRDKDPEPIQPPQYVPAVVPKPSASIPAPSPTLIEKPNYSFVEDGAYGYVAAVSEDDQKKGKAAGNVVLFRYAGRWDGMTHLEQLDSANKRIVAVSECANPCIAIKTYAGGTIDRVAYNPSSIVGSAFEDAFKGRLRKRPAPRIEIAAPISTPPESVTENGDVSEPQ